MGKKVRAIFFYKDSFGSKLSIKVVMPLNKETKSNLWSGRVTATENVYKQTVIKYSRMSQENRER